MMRIYAGNLAYSVTKEELRDTFAQYGEVDEDETLVIMEKYSNQSKGFGFVEMPNDSEANAAIEALNDQPMNGRKLKVNKARPKGEGGGGYRSAGWKTDAPPREGGEGGDGYR